MRAGEHCSPGPHQRTHTFHQSQACTAEVLGHVYNAVVLREKCICRSEARLGQSMRIPFREDYVALHISLVRPESMSAQGAVAFRTELA